MKITLNLAKAPTFRDRYAFTLAVPTLIAGLIVIAWFGRSAGKEYTEHSELQRAIGKLEVRRDQLAEQARELQSALGQPRALGTLRETEFVNALIERKRLSLADLTMHLAAVLPPDVRLSNLVLNRSGNGTDLRFQVAGKNEQALLSFIKNLQDSSEFSDPSFTAMAVEQQGPNAGEITIGCQTRF